MVYLQNKLASLTVTVTTHTYTDIHVRQMFRRVLLGGAQRQREAKMHACAWLGILIGPAPTHALHGQSKHLISLRRCMLSSFTQPGLRSTDQQTLLSQVSRAERAANKGAIGQRSASFSVKHERLHGNTAQPRNIYPSAEGAVSFIQSNRGGSFFNKSKRIPEKG